MYIDYEDQKVFGQKGRSERERKFEANCQSSCEINQLVGNRKVKIMTRLTQHPLGQA